MLESIHEHNIALAAYAIEQGSITILNNNQLNIKIVIAIKPIEETRKVISTSLACISAVIPLTKIKEAINKHNGYQ